MSEQQADIEQLRALNEALTELTTYVTALRDGAGGFAYMLPAEWQGPAMTQFLAAFELWSTTAEGLRAQTEGLQQQAEASHDAYKGTVEALDTSWQQIRSGMGA